MLLSAESMDPFSLPAPCRKEYVFLAQIFIFFPLFPILVSSDMMAKSWVLLPL